MSIVVFLFLVKAPRETWVSQRIILIILWAIMTSENIQFRLLTIAVNVIESGTPMTYKKWMHMSSRKYLGSYQFIKQINHDGLLGDKPFNKKWW